MPLWSSHPRVFLDIADTARRCAPTAGRATCSKAGRARAATELGRMRACAAAPACPDPPRALLSDCGRTSQLRNADMAGERILIVAPSWVGDAILSEPLVALLRDPLRGSDRRRARAVVVRAGVRAHARHPPDHRDSVRARQVRPRRPAQARARVQGRGLYARVRAAQFLEVGAGAVPRAHPEAHRLRRRSALRPADRRAHARQEGACRGSSTASPRLPRRAAALVPMPPAPVLVPDHGQPRARRCARCSLKTDRPVVILCPGAEFGAAKRWPPNQFAELAAHVPARRPAGVDRRLAQRQDRRRSRAELAMGDNAAQGARPHRPHRPRHGDRHPVVGVARRQQRLGPHARRRGGRRAAGRALRLVVAACTRRRCRRSRTSRRSTSPAARASSANARSATSSACAN